jgi:S-formylglutathione hydrolase FrmB
MALLDIHFRSHVLDFQTAAYVVLPEEALRRAQAQGRKMKVFYLFHGRTDDHTNWLRNSRIEQHAEAAGIAVVMPNAHRSFYTNMARGFRYFDFVTEEVPELMCAMLPISNEREDTFVAGLSMGGYGAMKAALTKPEKYAAVASLSAVYDLPLPGRPDSELPELRDVFGDLDAIKGSEHDLYALVERLRNVPQKPRIFQCCGTEDFLYDSNVEFRDHVRSLNFALDYTYEEGPGDHVWPYWDTMIQRVLSWLEPNLCQTCDR